MRLIGNKRDRIFDNLKRLNGGIDNVRYSDGRIFVYQRINVSRLTTSNNLIERIYMQ